MSRHEKYYSRTDPLYPECSLYVSRILAGYYRYDYRMIPVRYVDDIGYASDTCEYGAGY